MLLRYNGPGISSYYYEKYPRFTNKSTYRAFVSKMKYLRFRNPNAILYGLLKTVVEYFANLIR